MRARRRLGRLVAAVAVVAAGLPGAAPGPGAAREVAAADAATVRRGRLGAAVVVGSARLEPDSGDQCRLGPTITLPAPTLPGGARLEHVELLWAGSGEADPAVVAGAMVVAADATETVELAGGPASAGRADLTGRLSPSAPVVITDLVVDDGPERCGAASVFAGAALVVVYSHPSLPLRTVVVDHGLDRVGGDRPSVERTVPGALLPRVPGAATLDVVVWEGDKFGGGEGLLAGGVGALDPLDPAAAAGTVWDGTSGGAAPTWGAEVERAVPVVPAGRMPLVVSATSDADQILLGTLVLVVDDEGRAPEPGDDVVALATPDPVVVRVVANDRHPDALDDPTALADTTVAVVRRPEVVDVAVVGQQLVLTAPPGFVGRDQLNYALCDPLGRCGQAVLAVDAEVAFSNPVVVRRARSGTPVPVEAALLDGGVDLDRLEVVQAPTRGSLSVDRAAGRFVYTSPAGSVGVDEFSYRVCQGRGRCHIRVVSVETTA